MANHGAFSFVEMIQRLNLDHVGGLGAFLTLGHIEAHPIAFGQGLEAFRLDGRKVNENIGATILLDETETLGVIEPLYRTLCHCFTCSFFLPVTPVWKLFVPDFSPSHKKTAQPSGSVRFALTK
jgi:hypothetical protein